MVRKLAFQACGEKRDGVMGVTGRVTHTGEPFDLRGFFRAKMRIGYRVGVGNRSG